MKVLKSRNCLKQRTNSTEFKKAKSLHILCVDYFFPNDQGKYEMAKYKRLIGWTNVKCQAAPTVHSGQTIEPCFLALEKNCNCGKKPTKMPENV